jgi:DsbC/DsbD-like thiol-disulfide interchange protein
MYSRESGRRQLIFFSAALLVASLVVGGTRRCAEAGGKKSDAEVKVTAAASKPDPSGKQVITLDLKINKDWYIYANPVGHEDLASAQTVVTVQGKNKPEAVKIEYPAGKLKKDSVVGTYYVYEDRVQVRATVQRAAGDTEPLEVSVRFMACNPKGVCLLPATVKLNVP